MLKMAYFVPYVLFVIGNCQSEHCTLGFRKTFGSTGGEEPLTIHIFVGLDSCAHAFLMLGAGVSTASISGFFMGLGFIGK